MTIIESILIPSSVTGGVAASGSLVWGTVGAPDALTAVTDGSDASYLTYSAGGRDVSLNHPAITGTLLSVTARARVSGIAGTGFAIYLGGNLQSTFAPVVYQEGATYPAGVGVASVAEMTLTPDSAVWSGGYDDEHWSSPEPGMMTWETWAADFVTNPSMLLAVVAGRTGQERRIHHMELEAVVEVAEPVITSKLKSTRRRFSCP